MVPSIPSPITIADYCAAMGRHEIVPNNEYQRSDKVWPPAARSFLIETILLGYPVPKIFLFQKVDLKSKKTIKEIVDGQQRSKAIYEFFNNQFSLANQSEIEAARGKKYDDLNDDLKGRFLNYLLSIDLFVSVSPAEIRQAFRRLNSYTVPLNPEELRHAEYQGTFKWFIYKLANEYEQTLLQLGVLTEKQIVRMQDTKLFTECIHAFLYGVKTTKAKDLNHLYKVYDKAFPEKAEMKTRLDQAISFVVEMPEIHNSVLMKPFIFYSLILAVSQCLNPRDTLLDVFSPTQPFEFVRDIAVTNLTLLAASLESDVPDEKYQPFVKACEGKTNVDSQRKMRIEWLGKALLPALL